MKKLLVIASVVIVTISNSVFGQVNSNGLHNETRKIEVTGNSEMEIVPNQFYFTIALKEFFKDEKNQKDKVVISTLENRLKNALKKAGLQPEDLTIISIGGYQSTPSNKKNTALFLERKQYELKLDSPAKLDIILADLDERGLQSASMKRVDHSESEDFKKRLKIEALKAAQEKANYMVQALDEKLGKVLEIRELGEGNNFPQPLYAKAFSRASISETGNDVTESDVAYQKIKLSYSVQTVFSIL